MTLVRWIGMVGGTLFVLAGAPAVAQTSADAFFHDAAQQYVAGNVEAARRAVTRGLEAHPSDPRLQALRKKLAQTDRQRGGGQSSPQGAQSRRQQQSSKGEQGQERRSGEEGRSSSSAPQSATDQQSARRQDAGRSREQAGKEASQVRRQPARREAGSERQRARTLTRAQAARLLGALENQEVTLLREVRGQVQEGVRVEKDW